MDKGLAQGSSWGPIKIHLCFRECLAGAGTDTVASQSDTSLEGTPGTIWGLRAGSGSSSPVLGLSLSPSEHSQPQ